MSILSIAFAQLAGKHSAVTLTNGPVMALAFSEAKNAAVAAGESGRTTSPDISSCSAPQSGLVMGRGPRSQRTWRLAGRLWRRRARYQCRTAVRPSAAELLRRLAGFIDVGDPEV